MIQNDLQRLRWKILDEALRDPVTEYFMGERTKTNETGNTRSLIHYVNTRLKAVNREFSCSKRMLQNDVAYFQQKGARLEPRFRRGHKRILRYINLAWKNPLLKAASFLNYDEEPVAPPQAEAQPQVAAQLQTAPQPMQPAQLMLPDGPLTAVTLRITSDEDAIRQQLGNPAVLQRSTDIKSGSVTIQVEVPMSDVLQNVILGFGLKAEALAPERLRENLRQTIAAMQKCYKKEVAAPKTSIQGDLFGDFF